MGVDLALTRFFDACAPLHGPMLALGSLDLRGSPEDLSAYAATNRYTRLGREPSVAALMADRYGVEPYVSCDINGLADIRLDLAQPLPLEHKRRYRSVLNAGTIEHVFDLRQAMENVHDATDLGGVMIHTSPVTWFEHGFVNHNPLLYRLVADANGYEIAAAGYYYSPGTFPGQTAPIVSIAGLDSTVPGANCREPALFTGSTLPANAMYLTAMRKMRDRAFRSPTQVSG